MFFTRQINKIVICISRRHLPQIVSLTTNAYAYAGKHICPHGLRQWTAPISDADWFRQRNVFFPEFSYLNLDLEAACMYSMVDGTGTKDRPCTGNTRLLVVT